MAKTRKQKESELGDLITGLKAAKGAVFADFQGLNIGDINTLRRDCRAENVQVIVAKKTLLSKALAEAGVVGKAEFAGGVATFMGLSDEVSAAKVVQNFAKTHDKMVVHGGVLEHSVITAAAVKSLSSLPSKQQLLGQLVGTLNAPVSGFVNVLAGNLRNLVGVLNNIKQAKA